MVIHHLYYTLVSNREFYFTMSFLSSELDTIIRQNIANESAYEAIRQMIELERTPAEVQSRYLKQLHHLATTSYNTLQTMFQAYLEVGCNVLGIDSGSVNQVDGQVYQIRASYPDKSLMGEIQDLDRVICNLTVQEQCTLAYHNMNSMSISPKPDNDDYQEVENYIGTPIFVNNRLWGTLCFYDNQTSRGAFVEHDIEFIELMAQGISSALENAQSRQRSEVAEGRYRLMFENIDTPVILYEVDTLHILDVNTSAINFYGYPYEEFIELSAAELNMLPPRDVEERIIESRAAGRPYIRFPHRMMSGEIREIEAYISDLEIDNQLIRFAVIYDYSERHEAEEALRRSEANLRAIFDNTDQIMFLVDDTLSIVSMNRAARELVESISDVTPRPDATLHNFRLNADQYLVSDYMQMALSGKAISHESVITLPNNKTMYIDYRYVAVRTPDDTIIGVCVTGQDITTLKLSQDELSRERNILRVLIDNLPDSIYIKDTNARILTANQQYVRGTNQQHIKEVIGKNVIELFPDYGQDYYQDDVMVLSGVPIINKHLKVLIDDEEHTIETTKIPLRNDHNHIVGLVGVGRNITSQKLIEAALSRRDAILNTISNAAQQFLTNSQWRDGIVEILERLGMVLGVDRVYIFENAYIDDVFSAVLRYEWTRNGTLSYSDILPNGTDKWKSHDWVDMLQAGDLVVANVSDVPVNIQATFHKRGVQSVILAPVIVGNHWWGGMGFDMAREERDWHPAELDALMTSARTLASAMQREQMELGMRDNEEKFTQLITHIPETFWIYDIESQSAIYASDNYEQVFGGTIQEHSTDIKFIMGNIHPDDRELTRTGLRKQSKGETMEYEARFVDNVHGGYRWLNIRIYPIHDEQGNSYRMAGIASDITERKLAEEHRVTMMAERERVAILSQFVRDATHEFKTPLSIINTRLYLMSKTDDPEKRQYNTQLIQDQVKGISQLLETLMLMSRLDGRAPLTFSPIHINNTLRRLLPSLQSEHLERKDDFHIQLDETLPPIMGNVGYISEAVKNLVDNAVRYSFVGHPIELRTYQTQSHIMLEVQDYGVGISDEDLTQIFKRFYRKDSAHSTRGFGLGLPIVQRIAQHHGGDVSVMSTLDEGTVFIMRIPKLRIEK